MKNALITGATKGIGRAVAIAFAKQGLNLAICSRNLKDLTLFKTELMAINPGIKVLVTETDAGNKEQLLNFAKQAEENLGHITVIVNNVGVYQPTSIINDDENTFSDQINNNLSLGMNCTVISAKNWLRAEKGHIFNICSVAAKNAGFKCRHVQCNKSRDT